MKNNKGFSVIELIVSFSLTMLVIVILFEIIVSMKELYEKSITQAELVNKQNLMTDYIYSDIYNNDLISVYPCAEDPKNCFKFTYAGNVIKELKIDNTYKTLTYGDYTIDLIKNSSFGDIKICNQSEFSSDAVIDSYFSIEIPITNSLFPDDDFGVNVFNAYDTVDVDFSLNPSDDC